MSEEITQINNHIEDLRRRLLKIVIAVGIVTIFIMTFHATAIDVLDTTIYYPYPQPLDNIAAQITDYMRDNLVPENVQSVSYTHLTLPTNREVCICISNCNSICSRFSVQIW